MTTNTSLTPWYPTPVLFDRVNNQFIYWDGQQNQVAPINVLAAQSALTISSVSGTYGSVLTLATSGGTTSGAVTYSIVNAGSANAVLTGAGTTLTATTAGTCIVIATMVGDTDHVAVTSAATTITFAKASQGALTLTSTSGTHGTPLTLTSSGGSGTGAVTYVITSAGTAGATLSNGGTKLNAATTGTCTVTVTKAADVDYTTVSSTATTVTFA
jgi:hypothetical protein